MGAGFGCGMLTSSGQQIDAIFGLGARIAEMLLQSHMGYIELASGMTAQLEFQPEESYPVEYYA